MIKSAKSVYIFTIFSTHLSIVNDSTVSLHIMFLSTCFCDRGCFSLTEAFVGGGGKKSITENFFSDSCVFLGQKLGRN